MTVFMNPVDIIDEYYKTDSKAHDIMIRHGEDVAGKALDIARKVRHLEPDLDFIHEAAMLHDIAVFLTDTPKLECFGKYPYICHGYLGRELLESLNIPKHALVCERHVGVGITAEDVKSHKLPLPERDMIPITLEEQIICYADKFFSKTVRRKEPEKSIEEVLRSIGSYGYDKVAIFQSWLKLFQA